MVVSRFSANGAADRNDPTAFYRSFEASLGRYFIPFRDLVASLAGSPLTADLFIYPSITCTILSSHDVDRVWETCHRIGVSQRGGGATARFCVSLFTINAKAPTVAVTCDAVDSCIIVCGFLVGISRL